MSFENSLINKWNLKFLNLNIEWARVISELEEQLEDTKRNKYKYFKTNIIF